MTKAEAILGSLLAVAVGAAIVGWVPRADGPPTPVVYAEPELVIVTIDGKRVTDAAIEAAAAKLTVGTYTVQAIPKPGETGWTRFVAVSEQPVPSPPVPVPPRPDPPTPDPLPPVVAGKRAVLIVRESSASTPEFSRLVNGLRVGQHAGYLDSKGHTLSILDVDTPDAAVTAWRPFFADLPLPAMLIIDPAAKQLVYREALPQTATAEGVIARVKEHGG